MPVSLRIKPILKTLKQKPHKSPEGDKSPEYV